MKAKRDFNAFVKMVRPIGNKKTIADLKPEVVHKLMNLEESCFKGSDYELDCHCGSYELSYNRPSSEEIERIFYYTKEEALALAEKDIKGEILEVEETEKDFVFTTGCCNNCGKPSGVMVSKCDGAIQTFKCTCHLKGLRPDNSKYRAWGIRDY